MSHPMDYTPVCRTELGKVASLQSELNTRNTKPIANSVDPVESHIGRVGDINEIPNSNVTFPLIDEPDRVIADLSDMIHANADNINTVRTLFIIGQDKKLN